MKLRGKVWKLGDHMKAGGDIFPIRYDHLGANAKFQDLATHAFEDVLPGFAANVAPGDLIVAGENFGAGHPHFVVTAIQGLRATGAAGCIVESFPGAFQRRAINAGLPAIEIKGITKFVDMADELEIDLATGELRNITKNARLSTAPFPRMILDILHSGGFEPYAVNKLRAAS